jgi:hypothetical protein
MPPLCLVLSDDLLDASRVIGHGQAAGLSVVQCRDSGALISAAENRPVLADLDQHNPGHDVQAVSASLKATGTRVVGYGSHVDAARLRAARQAGCDEVLPRSAFFDGLEEKMQTWATA